jgi:3-oxoacyl-[acyl-carrier-protein] synthase-1
MIDLYIEPAALTCAVGHDLDASILAIRSGITALDELAWHDDDNQPIAAAMIPDLDASSAADRVRELLVCALAEAQRRLGVMKRTIIVCSGISTRRLHPDPSWLNPSMREVELITGDETTCAHVLARLRSELRVGDDPVLLCAVDSLIDPYTLAQASARNRLRTASNPDGFAPGEAAAAVLVRTTPSSNSSRVAGLGFATEPATILDELPHEARGMTEAARAALAEAGWNFGDLRLWIADLGGEHYEFNELALTHARLPTQWCPGVDLWHPSECVASIGAAAAPLGWILATRASRAGWTPGRKIVCSSAAANGGRAIVLLETPAAVAPRPSLERTPRWAW